MRRSPLILAALLLASACATAPDPEVVAQEVSGPTERYGPLIEQQAMEMVAAEPAGAIPSNLQITVTSVDETASGLFYNAELHVPARRRQERDYLLYGQCAATDLATCASQILAGARLLADTD